MPDPNLSPLHWKPVPAPVPTTLHGRTVTLEPLNAARHNRRALAAVQDHDEIWAWLADGPYYAESELHEALAQKQAGQSALFFAIVPAATGAAAGYASYMRIEPAQGVVEIGNILLAPSLQRTTAATEAIYLMARHVFEGLGLPPIRVEVQRAQRAQPPRCAALRIHLRRHLPPAHGHQGPEPQHPPGSPCLDGEWPARKAAFEAWLAPANFDESGKQRQSLTEIAAAQR